MKKIYPVFVHGWGFDAHFFDPLIKVLGWNKYSNLDLGFFDEAARPQQKLRQLCERGYFLFAVGHSLGFLWLLKHLHHYEDVHFVGINAFSHFIASPPSQLGVDVRQLDYMQRSLARTPQKILQQFYQQCGLGSYARKDSLSIPRLRDGLQFLKQSFDMQHLPCNVHYGILAGLRDRIMTPEVTKNCFCNTNLVQWSGGGHLLPLFQIAQCAAFITQQREMIDLYV